MNILTFDVEEWLHLLDFDATRTEEEWNRYDVRIYEDIVKPIVLKKGCLIGMETFVMPGVTVGEGAVVGAGSLVTKDIPAWTVATGRPAKVIKQIPQRG